MASNQVFKEIKGNKYKSEVSNLHDQNVYEINLCNERWPASLCQNVVEGKTPPPNFLSVLKPPNLSADMALAKEHYGKKRVFLFITSHYILFLGHCQPIKQSFQQVNKNKGRKGRDKEQEQRNTSPFLLAQHRDLLNHCSHHNNTWRSQCTVMEDNTRMDLGIPHYRGMKACLTALVSIYLF